MMNNKYKTMKIKDELSIRNVAGERVMIVPGHSRKENTKAFIFNATSETLWNEFLSRTFSQEDVSRFLIRHYHLDSETAEDYASKWINSLNECEAVE